MSREVGQAGQAEFVALIDELTAANQGLAEKPAHAAADRDGLRTQLTEAQDNLIAARQARQARQALRNVMRDQDRPRD